MRPTKTLTCAGRAAGQRPLRGAGDADGPFRTAEAVPLGYELKRPSPPYPYPLRCQRVPVRRKGEAERRNMREFLRVLWVLCSFAWAAVQTWWVFLGEEGVEADDPDKERETLRHTGDAHGLFRGVSRRRNTG